MFGHPPTQNFQDTPPPPTPARPVGGPLSTSLFCTCSLMRMQYNTTPRSDANSQDQRMMQSQPYLLRPETPPPLVQAM